MQSILTVTTPATSYDLTELSDVKDELGILTGVSDTTLARYISSASLAASQYCNRVFQVETVSENILFPEYWNRIVRGGVKPLQLMRWPLVAVTSVTENAILLVENTDYLVDKANGQLTRLNSSGYPCYWCPLPLVVVYSAGYATIPLDVEDAIIRMVTRRFVMKGRDPNLKQQNIPGVLEQSFWISTGTDSGNMDPSITDILDNYRTPVVL
jgi:hypothetical protein